MTAALLLLGHLALASPTAPAPRPVDAAADPVARAWSARGAIAAKRLAGSGLDACDRALEKAFRDAAPKTDGGKRRYLLRFEVEGSEIPMLVVYGYDGAKLEDFVVGVLPPGWLIRQPAGSRTLSVLIHEPSCAFDLCPGSPLSDAPCP